MATKKTTDLTGAPSVRLKYIDGKTTYDITELTSKLDWSGDIKEAARKLEVALTMVKDAENRIFVPRIGRQIRLYTGSVELFRGVVIEVGRQNTGNATMSCADYNWYLAQNTVDYVATKKTASQVIKELALRYRIDVGAVADTKYVFPRLVFLKKSIWEIFQTVIFETYKASNRRFAIESRSGKLVLIPVTPQNVQVHANRGENLLDAQFTQTMANVKTQVSLTGSNDEYRAAANKMKATVRSEGARKIFGLIQHAEHKSQVNRLPTLTSQANALLKRLSVSEKSVEVTIIGDFSVRAGRVLRVNDSNIGIAESFWVVADSHSIDANGTHTTQCTLSKSFDMEEALYEAPDTSKPDEGGSGESTVKGDQIVPGIKMNWTQGWTATAYNPELGGINGNGDGLVSTMSEFKVGRSLAVDPKVIPYGSVVFVKVPGYPKADGIYLAEDTGGAIKGKRLDVGWYKTDCKFFGKRSAQIAILERGTGPADARAKASKWSSVERKWRDKLQAKKAPTGGGGTTSSGVSAKRQKVVHVARSKVGKLRYLLGGGNALLSGGTVGDCSDFSQWAFRQVGISTPNYTPTIWSQYQRISRSQVRPGDLVLFSGTISGRPSGVPSHVGIITSNTMMVNLQTYGCREEPFASGYWGKYLLGYVRVIND